MTEFCKCTHHKTQHNVDWTWTDIFFHPGQKVIIHHICSGMGKIDFIDKDPHSGKKTTYGEPCPCKGFEPFKVMG